MSPAARALAAKAQATVLEKENRALHAALFDCTEAATGAANQIIALAKCASHQLSPKHDDLVLTHELLGLIQYLAEYISDTVESTAAEGGVKVTSKRDQSFETRFAVAMAELASKAPARAIRGAA